MQGGDCLAAKLRRGDVHSADAWEELLLPETERQQELGKVVGHLTRRLFGRMLQRIAGLSVPAG